jgi:hypothetical protein
LYFIKTVGQPFSESEIPNIQLHEYDYQWRDQPISIFCSFNTSIVFAVCFSINFLAAYLFVIFNCKTSKSTPTPWGLENPRDQK